jgi:ribulose-phosphate 3-epimerase
LNHEAPAASLPTRRGFFVRPLPLLAYNDRDAPLELPPLEGVVMVEIAPSILSADFARLGEQVLETERAGAGRIHIDVMDGHFVPNLSLGPAVVKSLRNVTRLPLEVHLMVGEPGRFLDAFLAAGADRLIAHYEVLGDPTPFLRHVHGAGKRVGLAVKPETPVEVLEPFLPQLDVALCMTVHPGFSGQAFLSESPPRIAALHQLIDQANPKCQLEVDGGIDRETTPIVVRAGANVLVAATAVFGDPQGPAAAVRELLALAGQPA